MPMGEGEIGLDPRVPPQRTTDSHDHTRSSLFTPLWIQSSFAFLPGSLSIEKWSPSEIPKYIVARGLLCDQTSGICRATCSRPSANAKTDRRSTSDRKSLHRPNLPR